MSHFRFAAATVLAAAAMVSVSTLAPQAASPLEKNFWLSGPRYDARVPLCEEPGPLEAVQYRFADKESQFWNSSLSILSFENVREVSFRPWVADAIPRRFCKAVALVSDGVKRPVYYSIIEDSGFAGFTWGVEWCVVGLDRNLAYNPACRMAKP